MRLGQIQFYFPWWGHWGRIVTKACSFSPLSPVWEQPLPAPSSPVSFFLRHCWLEAASLLRGSSTEGMSQGMWYLLSVSSPAALFPCPPGSHHSKTQHSNTPASLDCNLYTCGFLYLKLFPRLLLALHPLNQRQDFLTEAFADWPPRLSYTPFLCYHDSLWQIEFSEDGHSNISHHICSSYNITLKLLPSSGGRYVSYPWTYADLYDCLNQVR